MSAPELMRRGACYASGTYEPPLCHLQARALFETLKKSALLKTKGAFRRLCYRLCRRPYQRERIRWNA